MTRLLWVCLGGAAGTGARYLIALGTLRAFGGAFPWGTLAVNVAGSFLAAALMQAGSEALSPTARLALMTGVLGGFTTYSAFNTETLIYLQSGHRGLALANAAGTVVACLAAGFAGAAAGRAVFGA